MNNLLPQALNDVLNYLMTLCREGVRCKEAKARLRDLQQRYPEMGMDLLWEEESYDKSMHYDTLLHLDGGGTVSLSFCPDRALPWPLRGIHRWSEADLVRVNNTVLTIDEAIAYLDFIWDEARIINRIVNACLIHETLDKDPIRLSEVELQLAMDGFRRAHKLYTVEDTYQWLERHGMTHEQFERYVADEAMIAKLRDRVTAAHVEPYFEARRTDFDTAYIAQVKLPDHENTQQALEQMRNSAIGFYELAQQRFVATARDQENPSEAIFISSQRREMAHELGKAIFAAKPGEVLDPICTEQGYAIIRVLSLSPASLDEKTRITIKKILFEDWLAERRRGSKIEWYWGNAERIAQAH